MNMGFLAIVIAILIASWVPTWPKDTATVLMLTWGGRIAFVVGLVWVAIQIPAIQGRKPKAGTAALGEENGKWKSLRTFVMGNGLPGYLSGVSAVAAVSLATIAFLSWQEQEIAKRKGDVAMEITRSAAVAIRCFNANIVQPDIKPKFDRTRDIGYARAGQKALEKCEGALANLDASKIIAESILDDEVRQSVDALRYAIDRYVGHYEEILVRLRPDEKDYQPPANTIDVIRGYWTKLGLISIKNEEDEEWGGQREPEAKVYLLQKDLESTLRIYLDLKMRKNAPRGGGN